jgi:hypothetical protein
MNLTELADIGKIVSGIFLPIIALIGSLIAYQQYRIAKIKLRFELYQRRFDVYKIFIIFATKVVDSDQIRAEEYRSLREAFYLAKFLFKESVSKHLQEFIAKSKMLRKLRVAQDEISIGSEEKDLTIFFQEQDIKLYQLFQPYLKISI